jgi:hypothetical protein
MQADYSVELGRGDPALEIPWSSDQGAVRYFDLKRCPELVLNISEAREHLELSTFLSRINAADFPLQTAKCDAWFSRQLLPEEEIFGASCKFVSYVDLIFADEASRFSLQRHEKLAEDISNLLKRAPEMAASAEFIVRHCHYHSGNDQDQSRTGFSMTAFVTGYGDNKEEAHKRWAIALKLLQHALVQKGNTD